MELIGANARPHLPLIYQNDEVVVMTMFQSVPDKLVQSNAAMMENEGFEVVVQVVRNNSGGGS